MKINGALAAFKEYINENGQARFQGFALVHYLIWAYQVESKEAVNAVSELLINLQNLAYIKLIEPDTWDLLEKVEKIEIKAFSEIDEAQLFTFSKGLEEASGNQGNIEKENQEGIDKSSDEIVRPFEVAKIDIVQTTLAISNLVSKLNHEEIVMDTEFQRSAGVWDPQRQSRLIESILIKFPLPAFYFDVSNEGKWLVVDGLQRIWTIKNFVFDKKLKLEGLEYLNTEPFNLEGLGFDDLPRDFQRRIEDTNIVTFQIKKGTPDEVKFNLFKRINTGGLVLSAPEIRHALNQGQVANLLRDLANTKAFQHATSFSIPSKRMEDRDFTARFLAFYVLDFRNYGKGGIRGNLDGFINDALKVIKGWNAQQIEIAKVDFEKAMTAAFEIWGKFAFRKQSQYDRRGPINKAFFEVLSSQLAKMPEQDLNTLIERKELVLTKFAFAFASTDFSAAFTVGTGEPARVRFRHDAVRILFEQILQNPSA